MWDFVEEVTRRPPLVLGVDPRPAWHPGGDALGHIRRYSLEVMEALAPYIAAVKLQAAFFEALGPKGYALMHELAAAARVMALPVIWDAKRGDIGSTARAYAEAYLEAYPGSALTVNPYLGEDAVAPFLEAAARSGGMVFVLVKTSNPGSGMFQDLEVAGRPLYRVVAEAVAAWSERYAVGRWSRVGAVVGGTYPERVRELRGVLPRSVFLVPGLGAQGGAVLRGEGLLLSASRALYYPGGRPDVAAALHQVRAYLEALRAPAAEGSS